MCSFLILTFFLSFFTPGGVFFYLLVLSYLGFQAGRKKITLGKGV